MKKFLREQSTAKQPPKSVPIRAADLPLPVLHLVGKARRASDEEVAANPRSRSAIMRIAEKS